MITINIVLFVGSMGLVAITSIGIGFVLGQHHEERQYFEERRQLRRKKDDDDSGDGRPY